MKPTLSELIRPYRSVSIIGMCKNAGKTTVLNRIIRDMLAFDRLPTDGSGRRLRIYYCTQSSSVPPTFIFFVNDAAIVTKSFENHLSKKIREAGDYDGVPIRLFWRSSHGNNEKS